MAQRPKQHNRPGEQGGKDFWERICLVTRKDQNLTRAQARYPESTLISLASQAGRCRPGNSTAHGHAGLPESDGADMAYFPEQIRIVLPVPGFDFLRGQARPSALNRTGLADSATAHP